MDWNKIVRIDRHNSELGFKSSKVYKPYEEVRLINMSDTSNMSRPCSQKVPCNYMVPSVTLEQKWDVNLMIRKRINEDLSSAHSPNAS